jgi:predicted metal-dependent phosphoesterase TrpH
MLIDLHAHSSGISHCCRIPYDEVIRTAKEVGLCGIVLTNHYQKSYVKDGDFAAFARRYTEEFRLTKAYGDTVGMKVFFGAEVTMERYGGAHLLLYGIPESFIEENPTLFDWTMEEMYNRVKAIGGTLVQAHPYRKVKNLLPTEYLDGVEVNCHPLYGKSDFADMVEIATENHLILTCGGDYHADTYRPKCGVYLPDTLADGIELGRYLLEAPSLTLCIHEPNTEMPVIFHWKRNH